MGLVQDPGAEMVTYRNTKSRHVFTPVWHTLSKPQQNNAGVELKPFINRGQIIIIVMTLTARPRREVATQTYTTSIFRPTTTPGHVYIHGVWISFNCLTFPIIY